MQYIHYLRIADFLIELRSEKEIAFEEGYVPFLVDNPDSHPDLSVKCIAGLPTIDLSNAELVFEAENEQQKFYSIYKDGQNLIFFMYNQQTISDIQQIAVLNNDLTSWTLYYQVEDFALKYPFGPIMLHYLTLQTDAVMMHASCAYDGQKGRMFSGFSGAGKSTMSMIWSKAGNRIINDDRLIIRKIDGKYLVYNTPMYYRDIPKVAPLNGIFLISHSPVNKIKQLSGALAMSKVMAFSIQNNYDRRFVQQRLAIFSDLCSHVPVFDLGFVPDENVVKFILTHEAGANS